MRSESQKSKNMNHCIQSVLEKTTVGSRYPLESPKWGGCKTTPSQTESWSNSLHECNKITSGARLLEVRQVIHSDKKK